jgi:hypothetical protein
MRATKCLKDLFSKRLGLWANNGSMDTELPVPANKEQVGVVLAVQQSPEVSEERPFSVHGEVNEEQER